jgi:hypothetical protein
MVSRGRWRRLCLGGKAAGRRWAAKSLKKDEARRIAVNVAKPPDGCTHLPQRRSRSTRYRPSEQRELISIIWHAIAANPPHVSHALVGTDEAAIHRLIAHI